MPVAPRKPPTKTKAPDPTKPLPGMPAGQKWLSPAEVSSVLASRGFHDDGLINGIAIVLAESKGFTKARNRNSNGSVDRGLWQFNDKAPPVPTTTECADNPFCATEHAFAGSKQGTDFSPWSTFKSGSYKIYLPVATLAAKMTQPTGFESFAKKTGDVVGGVAGALTGLINLFGALFRASTWIRIGEVVFGAVLLLLALHLITKELGLSGPEEFARSALAKAPVVGGKLAAFGRYSQVG